MALTTSTTVDLSQVLADLLAEVDGLRTYWFVADTVRPPAAVIGQPEVDYQDTTSGFCAASWRFPLTVVVARSDDRQAQMNLSRLLADIVTVLRDVPPETPVLSIEPLDARPLGVTVSGQDLPGYLLNILIRA
jgi:hypothetical protein